MAVILAMMSREQRRNALPREPASVRDIHRSAHMTRILDGGVHNCVEYIRMSKDTFLKLYAILRECGHLRDTIHVAVEEQVALFLHIVGHHAKNRAMKIDFIRSGATVRRYFNDVLRAICSIRDLFVKQPDTSIHPDIEFNPNFYPFFKDCIGFIDGTHIDARVSANLVSKFRGRKGITQNVLAACDLDLKFTYILAGWEGSANDYLVLKDALSRPPPYGLHIPSGKYYLVDAGYTTTQGFISPYRKVRYHLREQVGRRPQNAKELFNLRHSQLRSRIERAFGILKSRFRILDSRPFFPFNAQVDLVLGCCVLHNFVREIDPNDIIAHEGVGNEDEIPTNDSPNTLGERREAQSRWRELCENIKDEMWHDYVSRGCTSQVPL
ncbi:putative nuclease HARBI1 [Dioscorea cayenensis subsp. rotundata]|uniref:Nuclease HARBI1 n=1 Tax=Dioscorea cayennensis subsp. rotundata TaxID=55577 RepID=A0AB40AKP3_DIOCR|nr:putative nuclease HARBI1 [Dioscorea cayenensis subsp. rotundata]